MAAFEANWPEAKQTFNQSVWVGIIIEPYFVGDSSSLALSRSQSSD
jgi:hypothetical protein